MSYKTDKACFLSCVQIQRLLTLWCRARHAISWLQRDILSFLGFPDGAWVPDVVRKLRSYSCCLKHVMVLRECAWRAINDRRLRKLLWHLEQLNGTVLHIPVNPDLSEKISFGFLQELGAHKRYGRGISFIYWRTVLPCIANWVVEIAPLIFPDFNSFRNGMMSFVIG